MQAESTSQRRYWKRADAIRPGDWLPFSHQSREQGKTHWLEVVRVVEKRTRVWITVTDGSDEWTTRPNKDAELLYREVADVIAESEPDESVMP